MIRFVAQNLKFVIIFLLDLVHRFEKFSKFCISGKHEFERICEDPCDIYEKTFRLDRWLTTTKCDNIRRFMLLHFNKKRDDPDNSIVHKAIDKILTRFVENEPNDHDPRRKVEKRRSSLKKLYSSRVKNLEDGDGILSRTLTNTTLDLVKLIKKSKNRSRLNVICDDTLKDAIYRILSYKTTVILAERVAAIKYDTNIDAHTEKLMSLWNHLIGAKESQNLGDAIDVIRGEFRETITNKDEIISKRWSQIGFQGEDPGTDFRGMGLLGLTQLEYLSRRPKNLSLDLLKRSLNQQHEYPWAIVGINMTYNLLGLFRDGSMKHLYFDYGESILRNKRRELNIMKIFNDLYVELFLRFDCFWHESKPENIFAFREVIEKFVDVIKTDLCNRNFTFKFIY